MGFLISLIITLLLIGGVIELITRTIQGIGIISIFFLWKRFKGVYNLDRFNPIVTNVLLWEKNNFGEYEIRFKIVNNEKREVYEFRLFVNDSGNVVRQDHWNNNHNEFFRFLDNA